MVGSGGQLRGVDIPEEGWGFNEVDSMRVAYGADLVGADAIAAEGNADPFQWPAPPAVAGEPPPVSLDARPDLKQVEQFILPDDGNPEDRSVARYPLPRPIAPGE